MFHENNHKSASAVGVLYHDDSMECELIWINPLHPELNPICHLLALLGAHQILHVSGIGVKYLQYSI